MGVVSLGWLWRYAATGSSTAQPVVTVLVAASAIVCLLSSALLIRAANRQLSLPLSLLIIDALGLCACLVSANLLGMAGLFFIAMLTGLYILLVWGSQSKLWQEWTARNKERQEQGWFQLLTFSAAIAIYILIIFYPAHRHILIFNDELLLVKFVHDRSFWALWTDSVYNFLYRPLVQLQVWVFYQLFGIEYLGYQTGQLLIYWLSAVAIFYGINRLIQNSAISFAVILLITTHLFTSDLLANWALDSSPLGGLILGLIIVMLVRPSPRLGWHAALFGLLILSPLNREGGLAVNASVLIYAIARYATDRSSRPQAAWMGIASIVAVALYFMARRAVLGSSITIANVETDAWGAAYKAEQIALFTAQQRLALYAYTVTVNLVSNFFPFFGTSAYFIPAIPKLTAILAFVLVVIFGWQAIADRFAQPTWPWAGRSKQLAPWIAAGLFASIGFALTAWAPFIFNDQERLMYFFEFALHSLLSVGMIAALANRGPWQSSQVVFVVFALGLIASNSIVTFAYARFRMHYLAIIGWGILLAISLQRLNTTVWPRRLRQTMLIMTAALIAVSGLRVYSTLPAKHLRAEAFDASASELCNSSFPEALAERIATRYGLDWQAIQGCRRSEGGLHRRDGYEIAPPKGAYGSRPAGAGNDTEAAWGRCFSFTFQGLGFIL